MLRGIIGIVVWIGLTSSVIGQEDVINTVKEALKTGSSRELSRCLNKTVEINFDGKMSNYSKTQAEFVLKDFFQKNPVDGFEYVHQGSSPEGFKYAIGKYSVDADISYQVWILFKPSKGGYKIDTINFRSE